ncbi:MAG: hypothetical protein AB7K24_25150 [Gemmataceae bacterium]
MFLLVSKDTKLVFSNGPKALLPKGIVLHVAADCPESEFIVRAVEVLDREPPSFTIAEGFDYAFPRRVYANILEYTTWDSLRAAARMCR